MYKIPSQMRLLSQEVLITHECTANAYLVVMFQCEHTGLSSLSSAIAKFIVGLWIISRRELDVQPH